MKKKGISTVVATVLIILITVAAVTIIWSAIIPMIKQKLVSGSSCMDAQADLSIVSEEGYTCIVNNNDGNISVQVKRGAKDYDLVGVQLIVSVAGSTKSQTINNSGLLPGANEARVISVENADYKDATSVQIAPIVKVGSVEQVCEVSERAALNTCV